MWYAVYDKHYRSQVVVPEADFELRHYPAAWDEGGSGKARFSGTNFGDAGTTNDGLGTALGLEDLRRIAVEGMTSSSVVSAAGNQGGEIKGEGEYVSMPLEGRMDLMRPRKEEPVVVMTVEEMGSRSEKKKEPPQLYLTERLADEEEA
jgi:hypothetical protein